MPGLSFACDLQGQIREKRPVYLRSLDTMLHASNYERKILLERSLYFLGCTQYPGYPLNTFETDQFCIYFEGQMYANDGSLQTQLVHLADSVFDCRGISNDKVTEWLLNSDGDFVIFIFDKASNGLAVINDALGRLPLYYSAVRRELLVSRELRFIVNLLDTKKFDRMAIAQYLLLGYPLGERTLLEGIHRLKPATIIKIDSGLRQFETNLLNTFNFELKAHRDRNIDDNGNELVRLFSDACKNRTKFGGKSVLSLSGGLDSRSIAACLHKNHIPFSAATLLGCERTDRLDVKVAGQLADLLKLDWNLFSLRPPKGKALLQLLRIKSGLNYLGMSFILDFFSQLEAVYGSRINFLTGDGGDKVLPDIRPVKKLRTLDALIKYIISTNAIFPLSGVAELTRIQENEVIDELKNHLASYPEREQCQKYVHFIIFERAFKWLFEGEDRNRFYVWQVAPFYGLQFFRYAMGCPDEQKSKYRLYSKFLRNLSPAAAQIDYARWKVPITSKRFKIMLTAKSIIDILPGVVKINQLRHNIGRTASLQSNYKNCLVEQVYNCAPYIQEYLSPSVLERIAGLSDSYQIKTLLTVTSTIEEIENNRSTIEKYGDAVFL